MCDLKKSKPMLKEDSPNPGGLTDPREGTENLCPVHLGTRPFEEWKEGLNPSSSKDPKPKKK